MLSEAESAEFQDRSATRVPIWVRRTIIFALLAWVGVRWAEDWFGQLSDFLFTLFLAWLLAITFEPVVGYLSRKGMRRGAGTGLTMLALLLGTVAFFAMFGSLLVTQLVQLVQAVPDYITSTISWVNETFNTKIDPTTIQQQFTLNTGKVAEVAANLGLGILGILTSTIGKVFGAFTLLLFTFYFSAEAPKFQRTVASWFPPQQQRWVITVWQTTQAKAGGYVVSRFVLAMLSFVCTSAFLFALDIPYWLPIGLWVGLVSQFIPTIGTYLAGALPVLIAMTTTTMFRGLLVLGFIILYQQIENYLFSPRISAKAMAVHPAVSFGAVIAGGVLAGPMGALIAIPVAAVIQALFETYGRRYELIPELAAAHPHHLATLEVPAAVAPIPVTPKLPEPIRPNSARSDSGDSENTSAER